MTNTATPIKTMHAITDMKLSAAIIGDIVSLELLCPLSVELLAFVSVFRDKREPMLLGPRRDHADWTSIRDRGSFQCDTPHPQQPHGAGVMLQLTFAVPAVASVTAPLIHMSLAMKSLGV
jgi:hypothetical protein